jgi:tripartite ATP-independent transporter DctM subunit
MTMLSKLWDKYCALTSFLTDKAYLVAMACLALMVLPVTLDVCLRSVSTMSVPGTIEIEEFLLLIVVFFSLSGPQIRKNHIDVDLLFPKFPRFVQHSLMIFHWSACAVLIACMAWQVYESALEKSSIGEFSQELYIAVAPFFYVAAIALVLLALVLFRNIIEDMIAAWKERMYLAIPVAMALTALVCYLPWLCEDWEVSYDFMKAGTWGFILLVVLLLCRMPIGYAMCIVGVVGMMIINPNHLAPMHLMGSGAPHTAMSYTMSTIPMFILMGELALRANISKDLFAAASKWLGRLPGGLAIASVAGCAGFAAIAGDSLATAMTMSSVALPEMKAHKYNNGLACAALASGGTLGILIPPSVGFIMYAIVTEESLGKLFVAGIIPGLLLAAFFCLALYVVAVKWPELAPRGKACSMAEKLASIKGVIPMISLVLLVLGGILAGFFTPTEGGAVGAAGTFLYAVVTRKLTFQGFIDSLRSTVSMTTKLMLILIGVNLLGYFLAATRIPFELADVILGITDNRYLVFGLIVLLYIFLGCMLNVVPMILLTMPAIFPTVLALQFDPVWFGVVTVILMEMGQITPPMGLVVFAISGMPEGAPMASIFRYVIIFVCCMLAVILLLLLFPQIALWLPSLLF